MSTIKDIRVECADMPTPGEALEARWPCAPEGVEATRSSGLICATVVARAMWSRLKPDCWPEPVPTEDAITAYTFVDFREDQPGLKEALREIWNKAMESASRQQGGGSDDSFAGICRSPGFVKAFWANPRFRLTTPHWKAGFGYDGRQVVLDGEDLARQAIVAWDGVQPATVKAAVDNVTFKKYGDWGGMTFAYFMGPMLLQVDFTPTKGSKQSLADIQTFSANQWGFVEDPSGMLGGRWEVTGQVPYTIMAVVLHRDTKDGVDSVRLFCGNGREQLPAAQTGPPQWPFDLYDPVPIGSRITLLYTSVPPGSEALEFLRTSERLPKPPLHLQMELRAQVGWGPVEPGGDGEDEHTTGDQLEKDLSVFTGLAKIWKEALARYQPDAQDDDDDLPERPAGRGGKDGAKLPLDRGVTPHPDETSMPPPNAPTAPRAMKRPREGGEDARRHDPKRQRHSGRPQSGSRSTTASGSNNVLMPINRLQPGEDTWAGRDSQAESRAGPNQQRPRGSFQNPRGRGDGERQGGWRHPSNQSRR